MAMSMQEEMHILFQEIDNLKTLLVKVDEGIEPLDALTDQTQKVLDVLPVTPSYYSDPIHRLLSCGPLTKTEIPLEVLEKLIESGFDVNARLNYEDDGEYGYEKFTYTCLNLAIKKGHYNAVRCIVQHGADCELGSIEHEPNVDEFDYGGTVYSEEDYIITPLAELALKANAPLDLFDLLATPLSLKNNGDSKYLPLHLALRGGHSESALRLIQFGADVNLKDNNAQRPIQVYAHYMDEYHDELFVRIIPSDTMAILQCVERVFYIHEKTKANKLIHHLFQNMKVGDHLHVDIDPDSLMSFIFNMMINTKQLIINRSGSMQRLYWWSLLLVNLGWTFASTPQPIVPRLDNLASEDDVQLAHTIDDIWNTYRDTGTVLSLQNVCIQQARRCMRDFSDDSFTSLPVPNKLRRLLMYQHVAEIACEAR